MRTVIQGLMAATLLALGSAAAVVAPTPLCTATLWAGKTSNAGTVTVAKDTSKMYVTYATQGGWVLERVELHFATALAGIPQSNGSPTPGKFAYKAVASGTSYTFTIPLSAVPAGTLVFAAHANVNRGGTSAGCSVSLQLPTNPVQVCTVFPGSPGYFNTVISGAGSLDGAYAGWCVDLDNILGTTCASMQMISSLDPAAASHVDRPGNLDLLNYLLNKDYSGIGAGRAEIQAAIWEIIDSGDWHFVPTALIAPSPTIVAQILADVQANGQGFVPQAGQLVAVILDPATSLQTTVIAVRLPSCPPSGSETAWAGNLAFPGKNWGRYFTCKVK